jgi:hypothetical protein
MIDVSNLVARAQAFETAANALIALKNAPTACTLEDGQLALAATNIAREELANEVATLANIQVSELTFSLSE